VIALTGPVPWLWLAGPADIRNNDVVKNVEPVVDHAGARVPAAGPTLPGVDVRTRDRVARLLLEEGAATAVDLSERLGCTPTAVRRHLDAMLAEGRVVSRERPGHGPRGRGRPAKEFMLTDAGRQSFPHTYDDLAAEVLRFLARQHGQDAVASFAQERVQVLEERCRAAMADAGDDPFARAEALAEALSAEGYAASASALAGGGQLCQHHCPVAQVAAEFPELCEAETAVISRLLGSHVQRLATIAHGDGVCTTHIPAPPGQGRGPRSPSARPKPRPPVARAGADRP
jgi:predicted ArsR family transcriptional regulator